MQKVKRTATTTVTVTVIVTVTQGHRIPSSWPVDAVTLRCSADSPEGFPPDPREELYKYTTPSTFKPTQWSCKGPFHPLHNLPSSIRCKNAAPALRLGQAVVPVAARTPLCRGTHREGYGWLVLRLFCCGCSAAGPPGSINQIPGECSISGDIRITPFYK